MIRIPNGLYAKLRRKANEESCTVERLLVREMEATLSRDKRRPHRRVKPPMIHSKRPGTLYLDNERVFEIIDFPVIAPHPVLFQHQTDPSSHSLNN